MAKRRIGVLTSGGDCPGLNAVIRAVVKKSIKNDSRPGQHGNAEGGKKTTEYGLRLEEKQKLKFNYGLTEKQLFKYIKEARRRNGVTGLILLQLLEMRLDVICFTLGFASSITQARQLVNHGHITVNQKVVNIPSFHCQLKDVIGVKQKTTSKTLIETNFKNNNRITQLNHLNIDSINLEAEVLDYCDRNDVGLDIKELLVIEYYSRR